MVSGHKIQLLTAHFFLPYPCCCWKVTLMSHTLGRVDSSNSHIYSLILWHSFHCLLRSSPAWLLREMGACNLSSPRAVAEGSCQVLESLGIWVTPSFPKATQEVVVPVYLLLGAKHVPAPVLYAAKILSTVPPDFVNHVLKNQPWSPRVSMYTSLRSAVLQSSRGEESSSAYRIKRILRYYKHPALVTSGGAPALSYLLKTCSVWLKNKFSLSLSKGKS